MNLNDTYMAATVALDSLDEAINMLLELGLTGEARRVELLRQSVSPSIDGVVKAAARDAGCAVDAFAVHGRSVAR